MINQSVSRSNGTLTGRRLALSTRARFILLILLFNLLLLAIVLLSIRNQEILNRTLYFETVNVEIQTRIALVQRQATRIVYVTTTFTPEPATATRPPSPTPTSTDTASPPPTPTETPTPVPTATASPTPSRTTTPSVTATPSTTTTPSVTATTTATNTPTATSTATATSTNTPPPPPTNTPTDTPTPGPPSVTGISPNDGGNESVVAVTINGANFQAGATVVLRRAGYSDRVGIGVTVVSATQITCQFDLAGAEPGLWDVVVTNPDLQTGTLPGAFTVNPELEHFTFNPIGNQVAGVPFAVTITAYDRYNNLVTGFTGTAALSDSTGTLSPATTGNFVAGVWTGNLVITRAQTGVTVTANSGGRSGVSNSFDVSHNALDHFGFGVVGDPQTYAVPFPISITAYDAYTNVVTSYGDMADLSDTTGTLAPVTTGAFASGTWGGNVTVSAVGSGDVIVATSPVTPTIIGASNPFTVAYPAPIVSSIVPTSSLNTSVTPVNITGDDFFATPSARLGYWPLQNVTYIDINNLSADVPPGIAAGTYDLYVTNPGPLAPTGVLPNAFTVRNADIPSSTLETSFVATFGTAASSPMQGDNDQVQVIFLEVPNTLTNTLYVRIFDPDVGTDTIYDERQGPVFDTATNFSLYGGPGAAYSDPAARQATFASTTDPGISSGTLLISQTFTENNALNGTWYLFATVNPNQGEAVGSKYVFKLSVVGANSGNDGNYYNVALSTSPTANVQPQDARIFAYSWTFLMPDTNPPRLYPFVSSSAITFTQHNFDFDTLAAITITTPINVYNVPSSGISGNPNEATSSYSVTSEEQQVTWAVECIDLSVSVGNDVTFWATDQAGAALPIFTRSTNQPAPP